MYISVPRKDEIENRGSASKQGASRAGEGGRWSAPLRATTVAATREERVREGKRRLVGGKGDEVQRCEDLGGCELVNGGLVVLRLAEGVVS